MNSQLDPQGGESNMSQIAKDYFAVEDVLQSARQQRESVRGKDTPFRVEFRYRRGTKSYQYFEDRATAAIASGRKPGYGPTGRAYIEHPLSQAVQVRGLRGGWKKSEDFHDEN